MKIAWISHSAGLGGAELCLQESIRGLRQHGVESLVVLPCSGPLADRLHAEGAVVEVVPHAWWVRDGRQIHRRLKGVLTNLVAVHKLRQLFTVCQPTIVITNTITTPSGAVAASLLKISHLWWIHECNRNRDDLIFDVGETQTSRAVNRLSTRILVASQTLHKHYTHTLPAGKLRVVYPAVEIPHLLSSGPSIQPHTLTILVVGHKVPIKRQSEAIHAFAILTRRGVSARLQLVGDEDYAYATFLRRLVAEYHLGSTVDFLPYVTNPYPLLSSADLVVNCCSVESFGRVTVEAMKLGRPVIGAADGGTLELIQDGRTGLLYQPGNPAALAEKIALLNNDRTRLAAMGHAAQQWACETFTLKKHTDELLQVFKEIRISIP